jgi:hypothetical protein
MTPNPRQSDMHALFVKALSLLSTFNSRPSPYALSGPLFSAGNDNSPLCYPIHSPGYHTLDPRPVTSVLKGVR